MALQVEVAKVLPLFFVVISQWVEVIKVLSLFFKVVLQFQWVVPPIVLKVIRKYHRIPQQIKQRPKWELITIYYFNSNCGRSIDILFFKDDFPDLSTPTIIIEFGIYLS